MLLLFTALLLPPVVAAKQPHLVMMVLDDLGWSDVGFHGSGSNFLTPQLDKLAADGVILDKFYVQQVCSPTRSALMTARYPFRTGLQHTLTLVPGTSAAIPKDTSTIAEVLKGAGYATHAIGKWHLGMKSWDDTPLGRGFDSWAGYLNGAIDYYTHRTTFHNGMDLWRNKTAAWDVSGKHTTGFYMAEARQLRHHFGPVDHLSSALYHPARAAWCDLVGNRGPRMLIGACNPMLCPNWGFRLSACWTTTTRRTLSSCTLPTSSTTTRSSSPQTPRARRYKGFDIILDHVPRISRLQGTATPGTRRGCNRLNETGLHTAAKEDGWEGLAHSHSPSDSLEAPTPRLMTPPCTTPHAVCGVLCLAAMRVEC